MNNHFADVDKKDTMSLTIALIVLDRLNTSERIDVARDNLAEAVREGTCLWASEIDEFPIAVTKRHFS